ncbi:hypothetical protein L6164_026797 [Bauhinia variegata]|uniref:Uncharacterized protein n=1 Tax=Bauhinia variegata TaxID=167791 RepID=A0ACB9LSQ6_BAUVA|nr:hypothetical protein L6164_026797 [Bauhinia variegata]
MATNYSVLGGVELQNSFKALLPSHPSKPALDLYNFSPLRIVSCGFCCDCYCWILSLIATTDFASFTYKRRLLIFSFLIFLRAQPILNEKKRIRNPWVPVGALVTAGVLTAGLISFRQGNSQLGQLLMRARVVAQGGTVALMVGTAYYYGENPWGTS